MDSCLIGLKVYCSVGSNCPETVAKLLSEFLSLQSGSCSQSQSVVFQVSPGSKPSSISIGFSILRSVALADPFAFVEW